MGRTVKGLLALAIVAFGPAGCGDDTLAGFTWDVTTIVTGNYCFQAEEGWKEDFTFKLTFDGAAVGMYIDDQQFATGTISGCQIVYHSVVWKTERPIADGDPNVKFPVRWKLDGEAYYRQSGGGCENFLDDNMDWQGTETFTVVNSENPDYPVGCTMELEVQGTYAGQID